MDSVQGQRARMLATGRNGLSRVLEGGDFNRSDFFQLRLFIDLSMSIVASASEGSRHVQRAAMLLTCSDRAAVRRQACHIQWCSAGLHRSVSQLTVVIIVSTFHPACHGQYAGMTGSGCNRPHDSIQSSALNGCVWVDGGAVSEMAILVAAPTRDASVRGQPVDMLFASYH